MWQCKQGIHVPVLDLCLVFSSLINYKKIFLCWGNVIHYCNRPVRKIISNIILATFSWSVLWWHFSVDWRKELHFCSIQKLSAFHVSSGFAFLLSLCWMHWSKYRHPDLPFRPYNVKLFTFQLVGFLLLSLVYIECAGYLYTNCDVNWETCMFTSW